MHRENKQQLQRAATTRVKSRLAPKPSTSAPTDRRDMKTIKFYEPYMNIYRIKGAIIPTQEPGSHAQI